MGISRDYAGSLALEADIQHPEIVQTKGSDQEMNMPDKTEEGRERESQTRPSPIDSNLRLHLQGSLEFRLC